MPVSSKSAGKRRAWLIGASQGMGREVARLLAANGWCLYLSARSRSGLAEVCESTGATPVPFDATDRVATGKAAGRVFRDGPPQVVLMNVGDYRPMPVEDFDVELFDKLMRVNYMASVYLLEAVIPRMRVSGGGQILLNASSAAYRGLPKSAPYGASKAAVLHMAESLRPELRRQGINLRVLNPGFVRSRLTDRNDFHMPFLLEPQVAAQQIVKAIDRNGFEVTFPRRLTYILKFLRCLPYSWYFSLMDRWVLRQ